MHFSVIVARMAALFAVMGAALVSPAFADDTDTCTRAAGEESIAACARLIANTGTSTTNRAAADNNRGIEYRAQGDNDRAIADYTTAITPNAITSINRVRAASLLLSLVEPAFAAEDDSVCDRFRKAAGVFDADKRKNFAVYDRAHKRDPPNGSPIKDPAACRALRSIVGSTRPFLSEVGEYDACMGANKAKFLGAIKDIFDSASTLSAFYCSKEEADRPIGSTATERCMHDGICAQ
jgi:hypothetical protein